MVTKKKTATVVRQSNDPLINHIKRAVKVVRDFGDAFSLPIPGVGGSRLIRKANKAIKKAITSK